MRLVLLSAGASVCAIATAEIGLRWLESRAAGRLDYGDVVKYDGLGIGGLLVEGFSGEVRDGMGGVVRWTNNAQGFRRDTPVTKRVPDGVQRVLSLGDSFTSGYRVGQNEHLSALLESWAGVTLGATEVLATCVGDPATARSFLEQFGLAWDPQVVVYGLCIGNDIGQCYSGTVAAGTIEQLELPADALTEERPPWPPRSHWLKPLRQSRIVRMLWPLEPGIVAAFEGGDAPKSFDACHSLGVFLRSAPPQVTAAYEHMTEVLADLQATCSAAGVQLVVVLFPQRFQVQPHDWTAAVRHYGLVADAFDLMLPNRTLVDWGAAHGVRVLDPTAHMAAHHRRTGEQLYLPHGDMHWNAAGHRACFEAIRAPMRDLLRAARGG